MRLTVCYERDIDAAAEALLALLRRPIDLESKEGGESTDDEAA